tara:strand:+ start:4224 stop:5573 length:1350 start_codon:yes stop_codon:yes gene_type:complete
MNYDLALVAAVLQSEDVASAIRAGADKPGLLSDEAQVYWDTIKEHYEAFHQAPSLEHFQNLCPTYQHSDVNDSVDAIVYELKTRKLGTDIDKASMAVTELNGTDPWEAKKILLQLAEQISSSNSKDNSTYIVGEDKEATLNQLKQLQSGKGLIGYPWPWDHFSNNSVGLCGGNVFYVYGRQKSRKTFLLLYMALFYWQMGLKVLFFTREMSAEELKWRIYAIACGLPFIDVIKGNITTDAEKVMIDWMDALAEGGRFVITDVADGISGFKAAIEEHKPQIVFHDYFKAMADDAMSGKVNGEHRYVARMADQMKSYMSDKAKVPLIFAGHANREGSKSKGSSDTEHAWSDHITRRVDGALRVVTDRSNDRMALFVNAGRSMKEGLGLTLNAALCENFGIAESTDYSWVKKYSDSEDEEASSKARNDASKNVQGVTSSFSPKSFRKQFRRR